MFSRCAAAVLIAMVAVSGCKLERRIINYRPFLSGLDNVQTGQPEVRDGHVVGTATDGAPEPMSIVIENEDGSVTLVARNGSHLMRHIRRTLYKDQRDIFTEQVLSDITRQEFIERGLDPGEAFDRLKARMRDIDELFARMPLGEHTPQVFMKKVGHNMFRVKLTGLATEGLYWRGFDMMLEDGNWRLRWFVR